MHQPFNVKKQMGWSQVYLWGLLGDASCKNLDQIALGMRVNINNSVVIAAYELLEYKTVGRRARYRQNTAG